MARLVVRITGEGESYLKMLKDVESATKHSKHEMDGLRESAEKLGEGLARGFGALGIAFEMREALEKFEAFEKGMIRMDAILEVNGRNVEDTKQQYKSFAEETAKRTEASKGATMALLREAESFNVTGTAAIKAAKDAAAFAEMNESSADSMIRLTAAMASGDIKLAMRFARMIPQLRGEKDEDKFLEKYNKLVEAGDKMMEEHAKTVGGRMEKLQNQMGGMSKDIGKVVSEGLGPLIGGLEILATRFNKLDPETRGMIASVAAVLSGLLALNLALPTLYKGLSLVGSGLKGVATSPFAWTALAVVGIYAVVTELYRMSEAGEEAAKSAEKVHAALDKISTKVEGGATGKSDAVRRMRDLTRMLDEERAKSDSKSWWNRSYGEDFGEGSKEMREIQEKIKQLREAMTEAEQAKIPANREKFSAKEAEKYVEKLQESVKYLGLEGDALERAKLIDGGLKDRKVLGKIDDLIELKDAFKSAEELEKKMRQSTDDLQQSLETLGMTEGDKAVYKLRVEMDKFKRDHGMAGHEGLLGQIGAVKLLTDQMEAAQIRLDQKTPMEKLAEAQDRINRLRERGLLTQEETNKALDAEREKILGAAAAMEAANSAFSASYAKQQYSQYTELVKNAGRQAMGEARGGGGPGAGEGRDEGGLVGPWGRAEGPWHEQRHDANPDRLSGIGDKKGPGAEAIVNKLDELIRAIVDGAVNFVTVDGG